MAKNSNFVLEWKVKNASKISTLNLGSDIFNAGGFQWRAGIRPLVLGEYTSPMKPQFTLTCDYPHGVDWKCEANFKLILRNSKHVYVEKRATVSSENPVVMFNYGYIDWKALINPIHGYVYFDSLVFEFHVNIITSEGKRINTTPILTKFSSPNEMSNVIIVIEDKKIQVSKDYLAVHSPVFAAMFFNNFDEKTKKEVEIKDVNYEEFVDLLRVIYPGTTEIMDHSVEYILKLADRFKMMGVMYQAEKHLVLSSFSVLQKLLIADQYNLTTLKDHCLHCLAISWNEGYKSSPNYVKLSDDTKAKLDLARQQSSSSLSSSPSSASSSSS